MNNSRLIYHSPLGWMEISGNDKAVTGIRFCDEGEVEVQASESSVLKDCMTQLHEYFSGDRDAFDIPLELKGTEFQKKVWECLLTLPFGDRVSYQDIAEKLGQTKACRAVGAAIGKNPVCILVPCHRVVGKKGGLTGFAWGVERKQWLLDHEKRPRQK